MASAGMMPAMAAKIPIPKSIRRKYLRRRIITAAVMIPLVGGWYFAFLRIHSVNVQLIARDLDFSKQQLRISDRILALDQTPNETRTPAQKQELSELLQEQTAGWSETIKLNNESIAMGRREQYLLWTLFSLVLIVSFVQSIIQRRYKREVDRFRGGFCINCGYDLRGGIGRCPECGMLREPSAVGIAALGKWFSAEPVDDGRRFP